MVTKAKDCKKGVSCGSTCIERADNCIKELSPEAGQLAARVAEMITGQKSNAENKKGMKFLDSINEAEALIARGEALSNDNVEGLKREAAKQGDFIKLVQGSSSEALMSEAETEAFADAVMFALPATLQVKIGTNGSPSQYWAGKDDAGNDIFKRRKDMSREEIRHRGREVIKRYISQGGIDAYTLNDEPFSILDMDVEHVRPLADSAKGDVLANDSPENWVLVRGGLNKLRSNKNLVDFAKSAQDWSSMSPEQKKKKMEEASERKKGSAAIKKAEYTKVLGQDSEPVMSGKASEAQMVHHFASKSIVRMSESKESAGRGAAPVPAALRKALITKSVERRKEMKGTSGDYRPDMDEKEFKSFFKAHVGGKADSVLMKERLLLHKNPEVDLKPYLEQDSLTPKLNDELFAPVRLARNNRVENFLEKGMSYEEAANIEKAEVKSFLDTLNLDPSLVQEAVDGI